MTHKIWQHYLIHLTYFSHLMFQSRTNCNFFSLCKVIYCSFGLLLGGAPIIKLNIYIKRDTQSSVMFMYLVICKFYKRDIMFCIDAYDNKVVTYHIFHCQHFLIQLLGVLYIVPDSNAVTVHPLVEDRYSFLRNPVF